MDYINVIQVNFCVKNMTTRLPTPLADAILLLIGHNWRGKNNAPIVNTMNVKPFKIN